MDRCGWLVFPTHWLVHIMLKAAWLQPNLYSLGNSFGSKHECAFYLTFQNILFNTLFINEQPTYFTSSPFRAKPVNRFKLHNFCHCKITAQWMIQWRICCGWKLNMFSVLPLKWVTQTQNWMSVYSLLDVCISFKSSRKTGRLISSCSLSVTHKLLCVLHFLPSVVWMH